MVVFQRKLKIFWQQHTRQIILLVSLLLLGLFCAIVLNRAWVGDDSYITFRVVDNLHHGYGLRWNVDERVQVYTHPLWLLCIAFLHLFTGEVYLTSLFFSVVLSLSVLIVFFLSEQNNPAIWLGFILFSFSSAFVDYSTSGLENPLSHFLLMLFVVLYIRVINLDTVKHDSIFWLSLIAGLGCLNRLDYVLIYLPMLAFLFFRYPKKGKALLLMMVGFLPLIGWLFFATLYYGFPLPNTYYAKLGNWLTRAELIHQGWQYIRHTLWNDPITGIVLLTGLLMNVIHRSWERLFITLGGVVYAVYVIWVGGDFMEGRFLTGIFLIFIIQLVHYDLSSLKLIHYSWIVVLLVFFNMYASVPTFVAQSWDFVEPWNDGVVNERYFYAYDTGLFRNGILNHQPGHDWVGDGRELREECALNPCVVDMYSVGFAGYYAGSNVHIVDRLGLGSALMARIPPSYTTDWRTGHFERVVPTGYVEYLSTGDLSAVADPPTQEYVQHLEQLTKADGLMTKERLHEIFSFSGNRYESLIETEIYIYPNLISMSLDEFPVQQIGLPWNDEANILVYNSGLRVDCSGEFHHTEILLTAAQLGNFEVVFYDETMEEIGRMRYHISSTSRTVENLLVVPVEIAQQGYWYFHILPRKGEVYQDGKFTVNAIRLQN